MNVDKLHELVTAFLLQYCAHIGMVAWSDDEAKAAFLDKYTPLLTVVLYNYLAEPSNGVREFGRLSYHRGELRFERTPSDNGFIGKPVPMPIVAKRPNQLFTKGNPAIKALMALLLYIESHRRKSSKVRWSQADIEDYIDPMTAGLLNALNDPDGHWKTSFFTWEDQSPRCFTIGITVLSE